MSKKFYGISNKGFKCIDTCDIGYRHNKISNKSEYSKIDKKCPIEPTDFQGKILHFDDCEKESLRMLKKDLFIKTFDISTRFILINVLKISSFYDTINYLEHEKLEKPFVLVILDCAWMQFGKEIINTENIENYYCKIYDEFDEKYVKKAVKKFHKKLDDDDFFENLLQYYVMLNKNSPHDYIYNFIKNYSLKKK